MKRTQQILMTVFVLLCLVSAGLYLMYTFLPETMPVLHVSDETRFTTTSVFILLTLATIPFSPAIQVQRYRARPAYAQGTGIAQVGTHPHGDDWRPAGFQYSLLLSV